MKKLFLFVSAVALTVSLNSCSSDSDGGGSLSFKVDGVKKSFKTEGVSSVVGTTVYGYSGNAEDPTETVSFNVASGTGANKVTNLSYQNADGVNYAFGTITSDVTTNSTSSVKGTFAGTLEPFGAGADITITEGSFSVRVSEVSE
jgi:hypothetical protein